MGQSLANEVQEDTSGAKLVNTVLPDNSLEHKKEPENPPAVVAATPAGQTQEVQIDMNEVEKHMEPYMDWVQPPVHSSGAHSWHEGYDGGYSQWREEAEHSWKHWDWPPRGWRPSKWQDAYWNQESPYYGYNPWTSEGYSTPPPKGATPSTTPPPSYSRSESFEVDAAMARLSLEDQFKRANTGDIFEADLKGAANEVQQPQKTEVVQPSTEKPQEPEKTEAAKAGDDQKEVENAKDTKEPKDAKEEQGGEAGENPEGVEIDDKDPEIAKKKKAALARYMRYYRSIRSQGPRTSCLTLLGSGPKAPPELRRMAHEAKGRSSPQISV